MTDTRGATLGDIAQPVERAHLDGQVLVRIAHEWRSAVAAMSNWLQVLAKPRLDGATHDRAVKGLTQSRDLQIELIEQLQDAVLMLNGGLELESVRVDLRTLLLAAIEPMLPLARQRRVELRVVDDHGHDDASDDHDDATGALGDARRLRQVLRSVISGALNLTLPDGTVDLDVRRAGDSMHITVRSSQVRVSNDTLALLLDVPHTPPSLAAAPAHGLGLELPFARHVAERHGGELQLRADESGGAEFMLTLPAMTKAQAAIG
jgi:two-component system sensor histidine kinase BaeS